MTALIETEIGTIAPGWKVAPLNEVCEPPQYGYTASAEEKGNVRFLRITDITDSGVKWPTVPFCECPPELLDKYRLASGDIVFARIGATTGKSYLIMNPPPSVFASYLIRVRAKPTLDPAFLSQFFRSAAYWRQIDAQKNANLKKGVSGSLLRALLLPVPSLPEQRKIAAVLGLVQWAIEQQERLIALTTELKKALMHKLFTEGLRGEPQKQTEIGPVPGSWEVREIDNLVVGTEQVNLRDEGHRQIKYIDVSGISREFLRVESTAGYVLKDAPGRARKKVREGDVIFATVRPTLLRIARIPRDLNDEVCSTAFCVLRDKNEHTFGRYLYYVVQRECFLKQLAAIESGASYPAITDRQLKAQLVPVPREDEQLDIAGALEACDSKLRVCADRERVLTDLFRTLLHQLMTAQIRVHDLDLGEILEQAVPDNLAQPVREVEPHA
jgi:type I restriction enzyme S subunit